MVVAVGPEVVVNAGGSSGDGGGRGRLHAAFDQCRSTSSHKSLGFNWGIGLLSMYI